MSATPCHFALRQSRCAITYAAAMRDERGSDITAMIRRQARLFSLCHTARCDMLARLLAAAPSFAHASAAAFFLR